VLYFPKAFWATILVAFLLCSNWTTFLHINTELVKDRESRRLFALDGNGDGITESNAAWIAGLAQVVPVLLAPFCGYFHARYGLRATLTVLASLLFTVASGLLLTTWIPSWIPMLVYSASLSLGPVALVSSIPLLLTAEYVGSGLGVYKSVMNVGVTIFDLVAGVLQDRSVHGHAGEYDTVLAMYMVVGVASALVAWIGMRYGWAGVLLESNNEDLEIERHQVELRASEQQGDAGWKRWVPVIGWALATIGSWIVFAFVLIRAITEL